MCAMSQRNPCILRAGQNKCLTHLTKGAFATIQWKSLMRLFDDHPPPKLNVIRSFSESCRSAVSSIHARAMSNACRSQRDTEAPVIKTRNCQSELRVGKPNTFNGTSRVEHRQFLVRRMPRYETRKRRMPRKKRNRSNVGKIRNNCPPLEPRVVHDGLYQRSDGIRLSDLSVHLGQPIGSRTTLTAVGNSLHKKEKSCGMF